MGDEDEGEAAEAAKVGCGESGGEEGPVVVVLGVKAVVGEDDTPMAAVGVGVEVDVDLLVLAKAAG